MFDAFGIQGSNSTVQHRLSDQHVQIDSRSSNYRVGNHSKYSRFSLVTKLSAAAQVERKHTLIRGRERNDGRDSRSAVS